MFTLSLGICQAVTVRIDNTTGKITARVARTDKIKVQRYCAKRPVAAEDAPVTQQNGLIHIRATPADGAPIDIEVEIPYRVGLLVQTTAGPISIEGMLPRAYLVTQTGDIRLAMPWEAMKLSVVSSQAPKTVRLPEDPKFTSRAESHEWRLEDKLDAMKITYGMVDIKADTPDSLILEKTTIPEDSPDKLPWQAPAIIEQLLPGRRGKTPLPSSYEPVETAEETGTEGQMPVFTSSVRLVNMTAAISDSEGRPIKDLKPEDFEVLEDKVPQKVTFSGSEEVPFNLALLLDLSGSTQRDRAAMKEAAKRFLQVTRPHDRVAAYALADNIFQVISRLTGDRGSLETMIDSLPNISGGSPIYDCIALSYAEEFRQRPSERNALIVISDGVDNQIEGIGAASKVSYGKLLRAAEGMNMILYPVFLDPFTRVPPPARVSRARKQMEALAQATGGRLFPAQSLEALEPVYAQVAEELRSVYSIAYYPQNQNFNGSWRAVEIRVKRPGAKVRTRTGYFAR
jgi:VWFA-related protein